MVKSRACWTLVACGLGLISGCRSTSNLATAPRERTPIALDRPEFQPRAVLNPGAELQWQVRTAQDQPGQVNGGAGIVAPDGTVAMGPYGSCRVAGLTLDQASGAMERELAPYMKSPRVVLSASMASGETDLTWRSGRSAESSAVARTTPSRLSPMVVADGAIQPVTMRSTNGSSMPTSGGKTYYVLTEDGQLQPVNQVPTSQNAQVRPESSRPVQAFFAKLFAPLNPR